jgi:hypothetical protein
MGAAKRACRHCGDPIVPVVCPFSRWVERRNQTLIGNAHAIEVTTFCGGKTAEVAFEE